MKDFYPHFKDEESKVQRCLVTLLNVTIQQEVKPGSKSPLLLY